MIEDKAPLFSIIIPVYNRAEKIRTTLRSILDQQFQDFEIIVVDDGSSDSTAEAVASIQASKVTYIKKENRERGAARNTGIQKARGKYVTFLDSDDQLHPHFLDTARQYIDTHNQPPVFHIAYDIRNEQGKVLNIPQISSPVNQLLLKGNPLSCLGMVIRKEVALQYPFSEERALSGSEDWVLWARLAARYSIAHVPIISASLIQHGGRSVMQVNAALLATRLHLAGALVTGDLQVSNAFPGSSGTIWAHLYLYGALHFTVGGFKKKGRVYLVKAIMKYWPVLFTRKVLIIIARQFF